MLDVHGQSVPVLVTRSKVFLSSDAVFLPSSYSKWTLDFGWVIYLGKGLQSLSGCGILSRWTNVHY